MTDSNTEKTQEQEQEKKQPKHKQFPCGNCGAKLVFKPGDQSLHCPYCGENTEIPEMDDAVVEELDYHAYLAELAQKQPDDEVLTVRCDGCGAQINKPATVDSLECPFCSKDIVATGISTRLIKPKSLLPFKVTKKEGQELFKNWIASLWFAPSALKKRARMTEKLNGIYIPYWTYDSDTTTKYTGQRGEHYWVTETYTTTVNGKPVTKTRQVRKTRWYSASGTVYNKFDDVLVLASHSLPRKYTEKLEPWDLGNLETYQDEYLSGFTAEIYQMGLDDGFENAKEIMNPTIRSTICRDIGGDEQRISTMNVHYDDITFKHILLPIWLSAYRYKEVVYRFLVNARTGEVQGERPWSFWKIFFAVTGALATVGAVVAVIAMNQ